MRRMIGLLLVLAAPGAPLFAGPAAAVWTKITLTELHCQGCARKIAKKLHAVPGVAETRVDLNARALFVRHKDGTAPSPRKLWDAVEQADHTPERLQTPSAAYTARPPS
jgi:copper chaperone CopZ